MACAAASTCFIISLGRQLEQWKKDIKQALELEVESVDCYPLDLHSETTLAKKIVAGELPSAGDYTKELEMYLEAFEIFKDNGYSPTCHNRFSRVKDVSAAPSSEIIGTGAGFLMGYIGRFQYSDLKDVQKYIASVQIGELPSGASRTAFKRRGDEEHDDAYLHSRSRGS